MVGIDERVVVGDYIERIWFRRRRGETCSLRACHSDCDATVQGVSCSMVAGRYSLVVDSWCAIEVTQIDITWYSFLTCFVVMSCVGAPSRFGKTTTRLECITTSRRLRWTAINLTQVIADSPSTILSWSAKVDIVPI